MQNAGPNHNLAKREKRARDGESWDPMGGAGVSPAEHKGYSGNDGKSLSKPASKGGGGPMTGRSKNTSN